MRPRLLDLFCGAGGCSVGYWRAGFMPEGVDSEPGPLRRYPFMGWQADAMRLLEDDAFLDGFDVIHASPPCQAYSIATKNSATADHEAHVERSGHMLPDTIAALTAWGERTGRPWVVENVPGSDAHIYTAPWMIQLCGAQRRITTANGVRLRLRRSRLFASNVPLLAEPCTCTRVPALDVTGNGAPWVRTRSPRMTAMRYDGRYGQHSYQGSVGDEHPYADAPAGGEPEGACSPSGVQRDDGQPVAEP